VDVIELHEAMVFLGRFPALAGVNLTVESGEIVALQGPNGAGKTTLLRLCAGLIPLGTGSGKVLGHDLFTEQQSIRRSVAMLGHTSGLYDDLTVRENVTFWAQAAGLDKTTAFERAENAIERMGVEKRLLGLPVSRLSAGQKRRTSLASLIVRRPQLWLLDEPHSGLDQDGREVVDSFIKEVVNAGATVVVASHELDRISALSPRIMTVVGGVALENEDQ
tara:strand:- start:92 stop:751 length:660 start_codon:yes stop_codon:yes gene_type:complete